MTNDGESGAASVDARTSTIAAFRHGIGRAIGGILAGAGNIVAPAVCLGCHARISAHDALCAACWQQVSFITPPLCDRLGLPLPFGSGDGPLISAAAAADPPPYDRARAAAVFDHVVRELIHGFKYTDRHEARRLLARWMTGAGAELLADADLIVPVPMTGWRLIRRQFNQAALLSREIAHASGVTFDPFVLRKTRSTPTQVRLQRPPARGKRRWRLCRTRSREEPHRGPCDRTGRRRDYDRSYGFRLRPGPARGRRPADRCARRGDGRGPAKGRPLRPSAMPSSASAVRQVRTSAISLGAARALW
jgi:predicted amidophosphoribosyltransferase